MRLFAILLLFRYFLPRAAGLLSRWPKNLPPTRAWLLRPLPGPQADGTMLLPNQWSLRPAGRQAEFGNFPVNVALHPQGNWAAVLHSGYGPKEVVVVDLKTAAIALRVTLPGLLRALLHPQRKTTVRERRRRQRHYQFHFADGNLRREVIELPEAQLTTRPVIPAWPAATTAMALCGLLPGRSAAGMPWRIRRNSRRSPCRPEARLCGGVCEEE